MYKQLMCGALMARAGWLAGWPADTHPSVTTRLQTAVRQPRLAYSPVFLHAPASSRPKGKSNNERDAHSPPSGTSKHFGAAGGSGLLPRQQKPAPARARVCRPCQHSTIGGPCQGHSWLAAWAEKTCARQLSRQLAMHVATA